MLRAVLMFAGIVLFQNIFAQQNETGLSDTLSKDMDDVVITATMRPVRRLQSPVPVEVYNRTFLRSNPTPSLFESLQMINGVRPQLNCNVCSTGDIHMNGLEGAYTMILLDGMPIVSGLASVYGLTGIPSSIIERIEVVKGPASALYGSEAVGGLINVITMSPEKAKGLHLETMITSWLESNTDITYGVKLGNASVVSGLNYFHFENPVDRNKDNFTDVTQQKRVSLFQKWHFKRKRSDKVFTLFGRYLYEDRWGGELEWNRKFRGSDVYYGESIYTNRLELIGAYAIPKIDNMLLSTSYVVHRQNSFYGKTNFNAKQSTLFSQLTWAKKDNKADWIMGASVRKVDYEDNTLAETNKMEDISWLPGMFVQNEYAINKNHLVLTGMRVDHHSAHGFILTPRLAYKWNLNKENMLRLNAGTGYRVVSVFTEDHAALTGARTIVLNEDLNPERSLNVNLNYSRTMFAFKGIVNFEMSGWVTRFYNRIMPDYDTDPNAIYYTNLSKPTTGRGVTLNADYAGPKNIRASIGLTMQHTPDANGEHQILTEKVSGTWLVAFPIANTGIVFDYTGNFYGKMRLPLLSDADPRPEYSPVWSTQNIQFSYDKFKNLRLYVGVKNLLNFLPSKHTPFLIARSHDPFDKLVAFDANNQAIATPENPYGLTFDPNYVYAPNQGIRGFVGVRYSF